MPKGCMLSHDNLTWETVPMLVKLREREPNFNPLNHRFVSYLPLSHIAGLCVDVMSHVA